MAHSGVANPCRCDGLLLLFITISGIYLWVALRAERRVGVILLLAGAITFWGLVYAVAA